MMGDAGVLPEGTKGSSRNPPMVRQLWVEAFLIVIFCCGYGYVEMHLPLNHDVAWLLDAGSRWSAGERLYIDLIEVNPPLIFYLYWLITLGSWTKLAFVTGLLTIIAANGVWVCRLKGRWWGIATVILTIAVGTIDFGQREHLALIVAIPYLFAPSAGRTERTLIGIWAFAGFGLKPYLMIIPAFATAARIVAERSSRPAISPENLVIAGLGVAYVAAVWIAYPIFFQQMVPLGNLVYFAYGTGLNAELSATFFVASAAIVLSLTVPRRDLWPYAGAAAGAFASFFLQGRYWSYHLVPAIGLTALVALLLAQRRALWMLIVSCLILFLGQWLLLNKRRQYYDVIPRDAVSVLFLSSNVVSAYPAVLERKVRHASHYPALWTLPGAWRLLHEADTPPDKKSQAAFILSQTRETVIKDVVKHCPDPIFVDVRKQKSHFKYPFDFEKFIFSDPRVQAYRPDRLQGRYLVYRRTMACPSALPKGAG